MNIIKKYLLLLTIAIIISTFGRLSLHRLRKSNNEPDRRFQRTVSKEESTLSQFKTQPRRLPETDEYYRSKIGHILPSVYTKIMDNTDSLTPSLKISQNRRNATVVMGIPSVKRNRTDYLWDTLQSLLLAMNDEEKSKVLIVVLLSDLDPTTVETRYEELNESFSSEITSGLIDVVSVPLSFYPDFNSIRPTLGDSLERTKWRTKENLDFTYLMLSAVDRGKYFLHLEDDILSANQFTTKMIDFAVKLDSDLDSGSWVYIQFSTLGAIGKLFHNDELVKLSLFFLLFHSSKPDDWLLPQYAAVKVCGHFGDGPASAECTRALMKAIVTYSPPLFQHIGYYSSLNGKVQRLKEDKFVAGRAVATALNANPPATVATSMTHHGAKTFESLYQGKGEFWAHTPNHGDYIQINFTPPVVLSKFTVLSGSPIAPSDIIEAATFEVKPQVVPSSLQPNSILSGFFVLATFDRLGRTRGSISADLGKIQTVRVNIWKNHTRWIRISTFQLQP